MERLFKLYAKHADAECSFCGEVMSGEPRCDGYPQGKYVQRCEVCKANTWYDTDEVLEFGEYGWLVKPEPDQQDQNNG